MWLDRAGLYLAVIKMRDEIGVAEVRFYHLTKRSLGDALPRLLEMTLERKKRALVRVDTEERAEQLAQDLWRYKEASFLPHGTRADGRPKDQPIWLSSGSENENAADFLFLLHGVEMAGFEDYERSVLLFEASDEETLNKARQAWKGLKESGHEISYWKETDSGGWEQAG